MAKINFYKLPYLYVTHCTTPLTSVLTAGFKNILHKITSYIPRTEPDKHDGM